MRFCNYEKCPHYSEATKYDRACYYGELQCWKGWLDLLITTIGLLFQRKDISKSGTGVKEAIKEKEANQVNSQTGEKRADIHPATRRSV